MICHRGEPNIYARGFWDQRYCRKNKRCKRCKLNRADSITILMLLHHETMMNIPTIDRISRRFGSYVGLFCFTLSKGPFHQKCTFHSYLADLLCYVLFPVFFFIILCYQIYFLRASHHLCGTVLGGSPEPLSLNLMLNSTCYSSEKIW